ncbi:MAG TPA: hypothetical protein VHR42_00945 [Clostridia bacterium]|nr:hypothetical protein [Clostridia bacterium]
MEYFTVGPPGVLLFTEVRDETGFDAGCETPGLEEMAEETTPADDSAADE